ncbi:MAG: helix-turn-helix domain-containing protein [archaeon]
MDTVHDLTRIGLTEGEAKVYLALSKIGSSTVGPVVKESGVAYSNIYEILNRLIGKGIVSFIVKSKTKYFQAASPRNLIGYLKKKEDELATQKTTLKEILPQLESFQEISEKPEAEVFVGKKGLKTAYEKLLVKEGGSELLFFYIHKKRYARESDLFYFSILDLLNNVPMRGITNGLSRQSVFFQKIKILNQRYVDFPIPGNIEVCNNRVLLVSWGEQVISVLINSKDLADNLRAYFNNVWKIAGS